LSNNFPDDELGYQQVEIQRAYSTQYGFVFFKYVSHHVWKKMTLEIVWSKCDSRSLTIFVSRFLFFFSFSKGSKSVPLPPYSSASSVAIFFAG
jgi:hypothetical protein